MHEAAHGTLDSMTADPFVIHRSLFFTIAYEMLGSAADAEDVVQETWLRWAGIDDVALGDLIGVKPSTVRNARARFRRAGWSCQVAYTTCDHCQEAMLRRRHRTSRARYHPDCRPPRWMRRSRPSVSPRRIDTHTSEMRRTLALSRVP